MHILGWWVSWTLRSESIALAALVSATTVDEFSYENTFVYTFFRVPPTNKQNQIHTVASEKGSGSLSCASWLLQLEVANKPDCNEIVVLGCLLCRTLEELLQPSLIHLTWKKKKKLLSFCCKSYQVKPSFQQGSLKLADSNACILKTNEQHMVDPFCILYNEEADSQLV